MNFADKRASCRSVFKLQKLNLGTLGIRSSKETESEPALSLPHPNRYTGFTTSGG
jgi:hypothetical protein